MVAIHLYGCHVVTGAVCNSCSVWVSVSLQVFPDTQADWSDCGPDGLWHGCLDQVEHYQTTHSGRHRLRGISVLGSRGSTGTMETLQSNKLIGGREMDTPVLYRVTEILRGKRQKEQGEERWLGCTDLKKEWRGRRTLTEVCTAKLWLPPALQQHEQHYERRVTRHLFEYSKSNYLFRWFCLVLLL